MSFRCIKAFMHAFSGRFSRTCLEGISFNFFVCFIFNVSLGSAPKRKNFDIQRNTRVASGGQFTLNYHTPSHMMYAHTYDICKQMIWSFDNRFEVNWPPEPTLVLRWISKFFLFGQLPSILLKMAIILPTGQWYAPSAVHSVILSYTLLYSALLCFTLLYSA